MWRSIALVALGILLVSMVLFWLYAERWRPLRPSTWAFLRKAGWRGALNLGAVHAYVYGRWTKQYLNLLTNRVFPRLSAAGRNRWADRYHGKVLTHDQARAIVTLNREIPRRDLEQIIPYATARDLVLKGPPEVAVFPCGCRQRRTNPCQPIQVCMVITIPRPAVDSARWRQSNFWRPNTGAAISILPGSRTFCWADSTRSATAANAVAAGSRPCESTASRWWHRPDM